MRALGASVVVVVVVGKIGVKVGGGRVVVVVVVGKIGVKVSDRNMAVALAVLVTVLVEVIKVLTNERRTYEKRNAMPHRGVLSDRGRLYPERREPLCRRRNRAVSA